MHRVIRTKPRRISPLLGLGDLSSRPKRLLGGGQMALIFEEREPT